MLSRHGLCGVVTIQALLCSRLLRRLFASRSRHRSSSSVGLYDRHRSNTERSDGRFDGTGESSTFEAHLGESEYRLRRSALPARIIGLPGKPACVWSSLSCSRRAVEIRLQAPTPTWRYSFVGRRPTAFEASSNHHITQSVSRAFFDYFHYSRICLPSVSIPWRALAIRRERGNEVERIASN